MAGIERWLAREDADRLRQIARFDPMMVNILLTLREANTSAQAICVLANALVAMVDVRSRMAETLAAIARQNGGTVTAETEPKAEER